MLTRFRSPFGSGSFSASPGGIQPNANKAITNDGKSALPVNIQQRVGVNPVAPPSMASSAHGGSRTEPPKRIYDVEGLTLSTPTIDDVASTYPA